METIETVETIETAEDVETVETIETAEDIETTENIETVRIIELNKDAMERLVKAVMDNDNRNRKKYLTKEEIMEAAGELNRA